LSRNIEPNHARVHETRSRRYANQRVNCPHYTAMTTGAAEAAGEA